MKQTFIILLLSCFSTLLKAQNTTQLEYDYLKKGIKVTDEAGLDVKKGYVLKAPNEPLVIGDYSVLIRTLKRADSTIAGISIKTVAANPNIKNPVNYYALPALSAGSKNLGFDQFYADINATPTSEKNAIAIGISIYCSQLAISQSLYKQKFLTDSLIIANKKH